jgi:predicted enzyme related to lactoylglutathione lyase
MPRPVHFEIHASDPARAKAFYESSFGWKVEQWGDVPYWVITTGDDSERGINGGMLPRRGPAPAEDGPVNGATLVIGVDDIDASIAAVERAGATVALPKEKMPGVGILAYYKDTEGNIFGMIEPEPGPM